jgi:hypothetical protein
MTAQLSLGACSLVASGRKGGEKPSALTPSHQHTHLDSMCPWSQQTPHTTHMPCRFVAITVPSCERAANCLPLINYCSSGNTSDRLKGGLIYYIMDSSRMNNTSVLLPKRSNVMPAHCSASLVAHNSKALYLPKALGWKGQGGCPTCYTCTPISVVLCSRSNLG